MENNQENLTKLEATDQGERQQIREWRRTTFESHDAKNWCYRKFKEKGSWGDTYYYDEYYCSNPSCKNQLIFQHDYKDGRNYPPFRFHKIQVKVLEKKEDDWKTLRKTDYYYAFCCKCAIKHENKGIDEIIKKSRIKNEYINCNLMNKCDCQEWINKQRAEYQQENIKYSERIKVNDEIIKGLEKMADKGVYGKNLDTYKNRQLDYYLEKENKERKWNLEHIKNNNSYLIELTQWENKRQQQLQEV